MCRMTLAPCWQGAYPPAVALLGSNAIDEAQAVNTFDRSSSSTAIAAAPLGRRPALRRPFRRPAIGLLATALWLAGCASTLRTEVTTFQQDAAGLAGQRFAIVPGTGQADSLEFASQAREVADALRGRGLVADDAPVADAPLAVRIRPSSAPTIAGPSGGSGSSVGVGVSGGGFSTRSLGVGIGIGFPIGGTSQAATSRYRHELRVEIDRRGGSGAARVFEGAAVAESDSAAIAPLVPALVRALFTDFPGSAGTTRVVEVPLDTGSGRR